MSDVNFILWSALFLSVPLGIKYWIAFQARHLLDDLKAREKEIALLSAQAEALERQKLVMRRQPGHLSEPPGSGPARGADGENRRAAPPGRAHGFAPHRAAAPGLIFPSRSTAAAEAYELLLVGLTIECVQGFQLLLEDRRVVDVFTRDGQRSSWSFEVTHPLKGNIASHHRYVQIVDGVQGGGPLVEVARQIEDARRAAAVGKRS